MIRLFFARVPVFSREREEEIFESLSSSRRADFLRLLLKKRGALLTSERLMDEVFAEYGYRARDVVRGEGKPYLSGFPFNLSHSENGVLLALSSSPVGCDLERVRPYPNILKCFSEREREEVLSAGEAERDRVFFRIWTAKESYLKMTGEGLKSLSSVTVINGEVYRDGKRADCFLKTGECEGFLYSVCTKEEGAAEIEKVKIE